MAVTILLTGFGPFPGAPFNPTGALVRALARIRRPAFAEVRVVPHVFPTSYRAVDCDLPKLLSKVAPDALLMFGLAGRSRTLRVETRARNAMSALARDAERHLPAGRAIVAGGPAALALGPARTFVLAAQRARVPAVLSRDAGRYLCNYLCWRAIEAAGRPKGPRAAVFVHVPPVRGVISRWQGKRRLRMEELIRGGEAILLNLVATARAPQMKKR